MAFSKGLMAIVERGRSFAPKEESDAAASSAFTSIHDPTPRRHEMAPAHRAQTPQSSRQESMGWGGWGFWRARFA